MLGDLVVKFSRTSLSCLFDLFVFFEKNIDYNEIVGAAVAVWSRTLLSPRSPEGLHCGRRGGTQSRSQLLPDSPAAALRRWPFPQQLLPPPGSTPVHLLFPLFQSRDACLCVGHPHCICPQMTPRLRLGGSRSSSRWVPLQWCVSLNRSGSSEPLTQLPPRVGAAPRSAVAPRPLSVLPPASDTNSSSLSMSACSFLTCSRMDWRSSVTTLISATSATRFRQGVMHCNLCCTSTCYNSLSTLFWRKASASGKGERWKHARRIHPKSRALFYDRDLWGKCAARDSTVDHPQCQTNLFSKRWNMTKIKGWNSNYILLSDCTFVWIQVKNGWKFRVMTSYDNLSHVITSYDKFGDLVVKFFRTSLSKLV